MRSSSRRRSASRGVFQSIGTGPRPDPPHALCPKVVHPGRPCVPSPVPLPDELHDLTVAPDAEMCARKKYGTLQEEIPDSPGRNTGLSRKKYQTLQEEIPDSPGRNTGLSRKKYRTLQGIGYRVFLQTIGFCKRGSCVSVYVLLYCLFINNRGLEMAKGGKHGGETSLIEASKAQGRRVSRQGRIQSRGIPLLRH